MTEQKISNLLQQKWISKLLGYHYTILYRKGVDNKVADALSRMHEASETTQEQGIANQIHEDMDAFKGEGMSGLGS